MACATRRKTMACATDTLLLWQTVYSLVQNIRFALRSFSRSPAFCGAALLALIIGIGATSAIFSVVDAVLWKPLPFRDPGRLLVIWEKNPAVNRFRMFVAPFNYREWQQHNGSLEGAAA